MMKVLLLPFLFIAPTLGRKYDEYGRDGFQPPPGTPAGPPFGGEPIEIPPFKDILPPLVQAELDRCGGSIVDTHLHLATWFSTPEPLFAEMAATGIKH
jgi:hypothetical protein